MKNTRKITKYKKSTRLPRLPLIILLAFAAVGLVSAILLKKSMHKNQIAVIDNAANPSCTQTFSIARPSPSPSPISSPSTGSTPAPQLPLLPSVCAISFDLPDQAVCWKEPRTVPITYTVHSLPPGGPYYVTTDWFTASPTESVHHYFLDETKPLEVGKTYTLNAEWPGLVFGNDLTVEIHAGLQVVPNKYELLQPNCTSGIDYYWTPFVCPI